MSAIEYMEKQIRRNWFNLERETARNAPEEILNNILLKISYYEAAIEALRKGAEHE